MSQRGTTPKSGKSPRSKSTSFHNDGNEGAVANCEPGRAFDELRKELERDLQNSEKVLSAANNFKGNPSFPNRGASHQCGAQSYSSKPHQAGSDNMKKTYVQVSSGSRKAHERSLKALPSDSRYESHKAEFQKFSHYGSPHHDHHHESHKELSKLDEKSEKSLYQLSQLKKSPSQFACKIDHNLQFFEVCCSKSKDDKKGNGVTKLPEIPCLRKDQIEQLIQCETQDVESAWYLTSEQRRTYKKPCPKQQSAQMGVRALVQASMNSGSCGPKYPPLEHPEPEDISPEVAATMMFMQEQGLKMEECPNATINRLFPEDPPPQFPEKGSVSVVAPSQKDQEVMIEKSALVPSEGVSDSAYTRTMKAKAEELGPQRSYDVDFAIGQSKREYVFVNEKPQRVNIVRFRGGSTPSWFPWYFSAFPDESEGLKLSASPSGIFYKAWLHSNPENIPKNDVIVLD